MQLLSQLFSILLLALGFGFVIFFHELGHFLAAKWVGIKVEQFAVGFGQAIFSWRKGLGLRRGTSTPEFDRRVKEHLDATAKSQLKFREKSASDAPSSLEVHRAATELGISETEYRLNWIPLGGYVKMMGQDDLNPNAQIDDPRAYNKKSIPKRMLVVSAGVIMNVILAALMFMGLFLWGFNAPPSIVGYVVPGSPAYQATRLDGTPAPLRTGDRIISMDGKVQHDFTKITLNVALANEGVPTPLVVKRRDGHEEQLLVTLRKQPGDALGFIMLGMSPPAQLAGPDKSTTKIAPDARMRASEDELLVNPGDTIIAINGDPVGLNDHAKLADALNASGGKPIKLTIRDDAGAIREVELQPHFAMQFLYEQSHFAGLFPRPAIRGLADESLVINHLKPGDVVVGVKDDQDQVTRNLSEFGLKTQLSASGTSGKGISIIFLRPGEAQEQTTLPIIPTLNLGEDANGKKRYGLGIELTMDEQHPVVADVAPGSPASDAKIPAGAEIVSIDGKTVASWFDVNEALRSAKPGQPLEIAAKVDGNPATFSMTLNADQIADVASNQYTHWLTLHEYKEPRKTHNPVTAAVWGVMETRDFLVQNYLTLQRMVQGRISHKHMMGPVGIFYSGAHFAFKGTDWLVWFLAMISANLAVVNFLPIPIVDGGLFTFLIIEKLMGRPLAPRTQQIVQYVGLALLVSLVLLVTYQDISRFL